MAIPKEIDEYFFLGILLIALMILYDMPLANLYSWMVVWSAFLYLIPTQYNLFRWIPFMTRKNLLMKIAVGIGFGIGYIMLYNQLTNLPLAAVFAAGEPFKDTLFLSIGVYSILIPIVENRLFFREIMQWFAWKTGTSIYNGPFSIDGFKLMGFCALLFTFVHARAFGITNNLALIAAFIFAVISVGMVLFFKELTQATVMHIVVNGKAMGLFDIIQSNPLIIAGIILVIMVITSKKSLMSYIHS